MSLGLVPHLSARKTLALGLLLTWYGVHGVVALHESPLRGFAFGLAGGLVAIAVQLLVDRAHELFDELFEPLRALKRQLDVLAGVVISVLASAYLLGLLGGLARHALSPQAAGGLEGLAAGLDWKALVLVCVGGLSYAFGSVRTWLARLFDAVPLSQERAVRRVASFAECLWTLAGLALALTFPVVGAVATVLLLAVLVTIGVQLNKLVRTARGRCDACAADVHLAASTCQHCGASRPPRAIGAFGRVLNAPATDLAKHRLALLSWRRCPSCAEGVVNKQGLLICSGCGAEPFKDRDDARAFARYADARVAALAPLFAVLGLVPVLGLVSALLVLRLSASGAMSRYGTWRALLGKRFVQGVVVLTLAALQPIPAVGALAALSLVAVLHVWGRRSFLASLGHGDKTKAPVAGLGAVA